MRFLGDRSAAVHSGSVARSIGSGRNRCGSLRRLDFSGPALLPGTRSAPAAGTGRSAETTIQREHLRIALRHGTPRP